MPSDAEAEVEEVLPGARDGVGNQRSLLIRHERILAGAEVDEVAHVLPVEVCLVVPQHV